MLYKFDNLNLRFLQATSVELLCDALISSNETVCKIQRDRSEWISLSDALNCSNTDENWSSNH